MAYLRKVVCFPVRGQLVVDFLHDVPMPTPLQRRRLVDVLKSSDKLHLVAGHALVVNSTFGRGLLTAINWVVRPPFEEQLFAAPEPALRWLEQQNPAFDSRQLLQDVRRASPEFKSLKW